ncbi:coiled-coil domain-containing protein 191 [Hypomesus transpacificus]|uniref:coiled-coil domain-containing protein 191 n=1 Tax=Hypomesus transpacificus TaxID=137520 RepID=UPI001F07DE42|nr:coiled-coil domain-containing protein 191 [Hypomesus transpacificus]
MAYPIHNPDIFRWRRFTKSNIPASGKVQLSNGDIDHWMKRVEIASEFAVSEVFSLKKAPSGISSQATALASTDQLQDHDEAYTEAQALLSDWMNRKLCLEMEGEDDHVGPGERSSPPAVLLVQPAHLDYSNFDDLYSHLAEEEESCAVNNFLQDLMELEVLDSGTVEDLSLDSEREKNRTRDPSITMEARHRQVRENRAQRDALKERQRREKELRRQAREEAQRRDKEEECRRRQEARRQEEMVEQEMVRLRRQMEQRRSLEKLAGQRERVRLDRRRAEPTPLVLQSWCGLPAAPQQQDRERLHEQAQARVQILNLKCLQMHFSGWYSVLLERRVRMGKAAALCDWRRQLRTWRAWRALVWAGREHREAEKTQEELRTENRNFQMARESDRRRLLRRCLDDWRLWCRAEGERRELLAQQEETRSKMAALISAAATGKLSMVPAACEPITVRPEPSVQSEASQEKGQQGSPTVAPAPSPGRQGDVPPPTLAWQVTRRHAELTPRELRRTQQRGKEGAASAPRSRSAELRGGGFHHRHANQQHTIQEQRRLLREQEEQIARLQEEKSMLGLKQELQRAALTLPVSKGPPSDPEEPRACGISRDHAGLCLPRRKPPVRHPGPHLAVMAMEERARLRAERRREVEEMKRTREEERLAQMKAAQDERQREEEEERRRAVERRREERTQEKEREQEKHRRLELERQLQVEAQQHYHRTLLLRRGLAPWKRLVSLGRDKAQLAVSHYGHALLRQCILSWQQVAGEAQAQKRASADQLHQHILLRRSLCSWKRLKDQREILAGRAERFHRTHTLRRVLTLLLDHVTQERLRDWDQQQQANQHSDRRSLQSCFQAWRRFPRQQREEREKEFRRQQLRRRVAEVLPDFHCSRLQSLWEPPT